MPYDIEWSRDRSTIGISMDDSMDLWVKAPVDAIVEDVEAVLEEKKSWILETLYGLSEQSDLPFNKELHSRYLFSSPDRTDKPLVRVIC
ncbi:MULTISPECIES: hypothetical protein [Natrialbaceae]|uniref:hypothetical protein n=1 Tax=Natrialbaceae TaxID=1644061 RepID=UPI00207C2769|nr:hypothetical protein [Natronococcus sp. CG52]